MSSVSFAGLSFELVAVILLLLALLLTVAGMRRRQRARERRLEAEIQDVVNRVRRVRAERDPSRRQAMERELQRRFRSLAEAGKTNNGRTRPQLAVLYTALAQSLVHSPEVDLRRGRRLVDGRLGALAPSVRPYGATYRLLTEAEASVESDLFRRLPESGRRALLLVYFHALEEYMSRRLRVLVPRGATLLLGDRGHLNLRRRGWEARWASLSLGNFVYLVDWNRHVFLYDDFRWNREVEPRLRHAVEVRNRTAHPGWPTPTLEDVRKLVFQSIGSVESVLKRPLAPERRAPMTVPQPSVTAVRAAHAGGSPPAR